MSKVRVLIVDDSVVIRRLLSEGLAADPDIEVVGAAADGQIALVKIQKLDPDLVILDMEMPVMDGLQTLVKIRQIDPVLPVIIFSRLTTAGTSLTVEALLLGANDYASKPSHVENGKMNALGVLIPKIKRLFPRQFARPKAWSTIGKIKQKEPAGSDRPLTILAIGTSTGGPNALASLLSSLSKPFPAPIVIVQHMPKEFTPALASRLTSTSGLLVREGRTGEFVRPGEAWLAQGGYHLELAQSATGVRLLTTEGPSENSCRPSVDVLFRSVAATYGAGALGVILTGMGQDGMGGCRTIRSAGGRVYVQDEASSVVWGMAGAIRLCRWMVSNVTWEFL